MALASSNDICTVQLLRDGSVIQEISEPARPEDPSSDEPRTQRQYERALNRFENQLDRFERQLSNFRRRVERSQAERNGRLSISFSGSCEKFQREPALPITELIIEGNIPEGQEIPRLEGNRIIMGDGTQFEFTDSGGRWFDANGEEIQPDRPFNQEELEAIERQLEVQDLDNDSF